MTTPNPGAGTIPASTTTAVPDGTAQPGTPSTPPPAEQANPSKEEWVQYRKEQRSLAEKFDKVLTQLGNQATPVTPAAGPPAKNEPTAQPADAALAEVRALRHSIDVKEAMLSAGISDGKARRLIELAVKAENPSDIGAFVADYAAVLAKAAPAPATGGAAIPAVPPPSPGRTDTGAPGTRPDAPLSANPNQIPPDVWKALSPEKRREHLGAWLAEGGQTNWMKGRKKP